jgi:hypothetical protein
MNHPQIRRAVTIATCCLVSVIVYFLGVLPPTTNLA